MQNAEFKKEEFHKYLEKSGVLDQLTKVLVGLYEVPERPGNAIEFIKDFLPGPTGHDTSKLQATIEEQQKQIKSKDERIATLTKLVEELKLQGGSTGNAGGTKTNQ